MLFQTELISDDELQWYSIKRKATEKSAGYQAEKLVPAQDQF